MQNMQQSAGLVLLCFKILYCILSIAIVVIGKADYSYGYVYNLGTQWAHSFSKLKGKWSRFVLQRRERRPRYDNLIILFWSFGSKERKRALFLWFILTTRGRVQVSKWLLDSDSSWHVLVFHRVSRVNWQMFFHSPFYLAARCALLSDKRIVYFVKQMKDMDAICSLSGWTTATHNSEEAWWPPIFWLAVAAGRWPSSAWGREEDQTRLPGSLLRGRLRKCVANHVLLHTSRSDHGG